MGDGRCSLSLAFIQRQAKSPDRGQHGFLDTSDYIRRSENFAYCPKVPQSCSSQMKTVIATQFMGYVFPMFPRSAIELLSRDYYISYVLPPSPTMYCTLGSEISEDSLVRPARGNPPLCRIPRLW